ncbi:glycosyltransferase family 2 protein [Planctomicrobium piriforme]|uniref:Glycosyltransferase involved in cell wall bisynthesis n=1 Tax=Planctomicrobium piriforme TaxID=1576369 RepID=A0A1I3QH59_9PLAN|nr:glycosyltransferase family 2 protein [Planctomicrobium piriforme]SFJ32546.1 Glycosyltransferase involved in cell wall bisynthesis [Planctomicrobium piriforme]
MTPRILTALPVYNEEKHLLDVLPEVRQYSQDVLVVDDGSTDRTPQLLMEMEGIAVIRHEKNQGYGGGLRTAFQYAVQNGYDVLVTIDCDGQHQPRLIPAMAAEVFADKSQPWDIISGSRYLEIFDDNSIPPADRRRVNVEITKLLRDCLGLELTDSFCGFKAYRVDALPLFEVTELGYAMPLQFWVQAVRHQMRIKEFPVPLVYLDEKRSFGGALDDATERMRYYREVLRREMEAQNVPCGSDRTDEQAG